MANKAALTAVFETGDTPQGADFANLINSSLNLDETGSQSVAGSIAAVGSVSAGGLSTSTSLAVGVQSLVGVGTVQGTAAVITGSLVIGTTDASNYAFLLPAPEGAVTFFVNTTATTASVFPPVGSKIDGGATDAAVSVASGAKSLFICESSVQYRSFAV